MAELDVAIVGGGVCGLTCAVALSRLGLKANVYEAAAKFGEIGNGVGIGQNAIRILRAIGVFEDVLAKSGESARSTDRMFRFHSGMEGHQLIYAYPDDPQGGTIGVPRSSFLDALVEHVEPQYAHFNKRCVSVTSSGPAQRPVIHFADGSSVDADVVLLADGIRGSGREAITGTHPKNNVAFSNNVCYRGMVPTAAARANGVTMDLSLQLTCFTGMDKHVIVFPIRGGEILNVVAFVIDRTVGIGEANLPDGHPTVLTATKEELLKEYDGWGPDVIGVLKCIEHPSKWFINVTYPPLDSYVKGKVALLGDAAHGMEPHLGAGAGQGIEDAYLLAQLLTDTRTKWDNVEGVLRAYDAVRRPRAQSVWEGSVRNARVYQGYGEHGSSDEGRRQDLIGVWDFIWHHGMDDDYKAAGELLMQQGIYEDKGPENSVSQ